LLGIFQSDEHNNPASIFGRIIFFVCFCNALKNLLLFLWFFRLLFLGFNFLILPICGLIGIAAPDYARQRVVTGSALFLETLVLFCIQGVLWKSEDAFKVCFFIFFFFYSQVFDGLLLVDDSAFIASMDVAYTYTALDQGVQQHKYSSKPLPPTPTSAIDYLPPSPLDQHVQNFESEAVTI
jgi:hypothetical protein